MLEKINLVLAKLKPSEYRKYWKIWSSDYKNRYDNIFGVNVNRIYIPINSEKSVKEIENSLDMKTKRDVNTLLLLIFKICNLTNTKLTNLSLENIINNIIEVKNPDGKITKIKLGKFLSMYKNKYKENNEIYPIIEEAESTYLKVSNIIGKYYNKNVEDKNSLLICISRHPYDIAGMSTDRNWTSCMNLRNTEGDSRETEHNKEIFNAVKEGSLVAYLIKKDDKNIKNPLSRILLVPYVNSNDKNDIILYPSSKIYGTEYNEFKTTLTKWLDKIFEEHYGRFVINPKVYDDHNSKEVNKNYEKLKKMLLESKNFINSEEQKEYFDIYLSESYKNLENYLLPIIEGYYKQNSLDCVSFEETSSGIIMVVKNFKGQLYSASVQGEYDIKDTAFENCKISINKNMKISNTSFDDSSIDIENSLFAVNFSAINTKIKTKDTSNDNILLKKTDLTNCELSSKSIEIEDSSVLNCKIVSEKIDFKNSEVLDSETSKTIFIVITEGDIPKELIKELEKEDPNSYILKKY